MKVQRKQSEPAKAQLCGRRRLFGLAQPPRAVASHAAPFSAPSPPQFVALTHQTPQTFPAASSNKESDGSDLEKVGGRAGRCVRSVAAFAIRVPHGYMTHPSLGARLLAQCVLFLATAAVSSGFRAFAQMPIAVQRARATRAVSLRMAEDASAVLARMQAMMNGAYTPAPAAYAPQRSANIRKYENAWVRLPCSWCR